MEPERLLVIILAATLLILLVLSIVFVSILILITRSIRRMTNKAEIATSNLAETLKIVGQRLTPVALTAMVGSAIRRALRRRKED